MFAMNWGMDYWVSYSFYCPASPQTKSKSMKKHRSRTTVSTSREQTAITHNSLGALQPNKDVRAPLAWANTMISRFSPLAPSFTKNKAGKEVNRFFSRYAIIYPICFNPLHWKICVALLCLVFADPVTIISNYLLVFEWRWGIVHNRRCVGKYAKLVVKSSVGGFAVQGMWHTKFYKILNNLAKS